MHMISEGMEVWSND